MTGPVATRGLFDSLRRLLDTAVEIVEVRVELFGSELEHEKLRLFDALLRAAAGLLLIGLALVMAIGFVLLLFQEAYRLPALGVLMLGYAGAGWWLLRRARRGLRAAEGGAFSLSLGELRRDRAGLDVGDRARPE